MSGLPEAARSMRLGRAGRVLLPEVLSFAVREGIAARLRAISPFSFDEACAALAADPGYALGRGNRRRMVRLLLDLLAESGWLEPSADPARWAFRLPEVPSADVPPGPEADDGAIRFFRHCLALVPGYLRGEDPPIDFDAESVCAWEDFLGCDEFQACRKVLFDLMPPVTGRPRRLLDLCHGPGWGIERAVAQCPGARICAVDFTDSFSATAHRRAEAACARSVRDGFPASPVEWFGPAEWKGFGHPLPFADGAFDAVLFSCGDPYIPPPIREAVYRELWRVLAPAGVLGILTRGYPDPERRHVSLFWLRVTALVHDFAESVCAGWHGFAEVEESIGMFDAIGFRGAVDASGRMNLLDASLWLLRKG